MGSVIRKAPHPSQSVLWQHYATGDFIDGYSVQSSADVVQALATALATPGWARALMSLRNALVRPFGLHTPGPAENGGIAAFPLTHESESERVVGFDDNHLDFRISVLRQDGRVHFATWVHPHNLWGRAYLAAVMPFHIAILRNLCRRVARSYP